MTVGLRLVVFADGAWGADTIRRLEGGPHRSVCIVARERPSDSTVAEVAQELGIPLLQPGRVNHPAVLEQLRELSPDLGLSIAYNQILGRELLAVPRLGCLNLHAGMLPFYRGRNVINWAIINGEREIGVTAHFMDEGIDTGDVLLQRALPIGWTDTYGDVLCRVVQVIPDLAEEAVKLVAAGGYATRPQPGTGSYVGAREDGDEWLDWSDSSANLHNKIRGISRPGPGARTLLGEQPVTIWRAYFDPSWPRYLGTPGQVVARRPGEGVLVKTGDSTLLVQEVELDGQAPAPASWPVGTRLGLDLRQAVRSLLERVAALERQNRNAGER
jgi:methionyl-tRNA formyltransferase